MHGRSDIGDDIQRVVRVQGLCGNANVGHDGYAMFSELYAQEDQGSYDTTRSLDSKSRREMRGVTERSRGVETPISLYKWGEMKYEDWSEDKYEYEDGHWHGHDMSMEQMKETRE